MITKIISVDFDGTLCNSVVPEEGKKIWKEKTGEIYPHVGWWGRLESLDQNVFELNLFPNVVNLIKKYNSDPNSLVIILTNRMGKFEPIIKDILDKNNLHVDDIIFIV